MLKLSGTSSFLNLTPHLVETEVGEFTHGKLVNWETFIENDISLRKQNSAGNFTSHLKFSHRGNNKKTFEQIFFISLCPQKLTGRNSCECITAKIYTYNLGKFKMSCDGEESATDNDVHM